MGIGAITSLFLNISAHSTLRVCLVKKQGCQDWIANVRIGCQPTSLFAYVQLKSKDVRIGLQDCKYCQDGINEYCRDSILYLLELDQWKSNNLDIQNKLINEDLFIVTADVIALCPNINRNTLRDALTTALNLQSQFCALGQRYFVELIMHTLESVIIQHGQNFYKQSNGIITGNNHSVSLANIAMQFCYNSGIPYLKKKRLFIKDSLTTLFLLLLEKTQRKI